MEKVVSFLTNNLIVIWIAPIVTGLILAIILKVFSINKSKKEIKRANLEYKNAILPYVLQKINIGESVLHAIRDAISKETGIPKKHLYSDHELMNMLIYDITKTRFSTEEGKKELIDHICNMFSFDKDRDEDIEKGKEKHSNNLMAKLSAGIGVFGIVCTLIIYFYDPQATQDTYGTAAVLFSLLLIISVISFSVTFLSMPIVSDYYEKGLIGIISEAEISLIQSLLTIIFGRRRYKEEKVEENSDNEDSKD